MTRSLSERIEEYVQACFTGLWIQSHEHEDALAELAGLCRTHGWRLAVWDIDGGLQVPGAAQAGSDAAGDPQATADPLAAVRAAGTLADGETPALLVLVNFHRFLQSAEVVQAVCRQITAGKQSRQFLVVLAPVVELPAELERLFVVLEHELPGHRQLEQIARSVATEEGELPEGDKLQRLLDAASGLTRYEAEGAFALALVRHGRLEAQTIWELKCQTLKRSGLVELYRGEEDFSSLGGLQSLKDFCRRSHQQAAGCDCCRAAAAINLCLPRKLHLAGRAQEPRCRAKGSGGRADSPRHKPPVAAGRPQLVWESR